MALHLIQYLELFSYLIKSKSNNNNLGIECIFADIKDPEFCVLTFSKE